MVEILTDSRNRTAGEIRKIFDNHGARLGAPNEVAWMYSLKGLFSVEADKVDEDTLMEIALDAGAEEMEQVGDLYELTCETSEFEGLKQALADADIPTGVAEITMIPQSVVELDEKNGRKILALMEALEDHEDVQNVHANFQLPEAMLLEETRG